MMNRKKKNKKNQAVRGVFVMVLYGPLPQRWMSYNPVPPTPPPFFFLFNVFLRRHYPDRTGKILMMERSLDDRLCCSLRRRKKKETIDAIPMKIQSILVFLFASCLFFFNGYINFNVSMRLNRFCHVYRPLINYYNVGKERFFVRLFRTQQFQSNLFLNPWRHFIYSF